MLGTEKVEDMEDDGCVKMEENCVTEMGNPPMNCSFARHLAGEMANLTHLLITKHQPSWKSKLRSL